MKGIECEYEFYDFYFVVTKRKKKGTERKGVERERKKKRISEGKMMYDTKYSK